MGECENMGIVILTKVLSYSNSLDGRYRIVGIKGLQTVFRHV